MKKFLGDFIQRLSSRKFLLTVAGLVGVTTLPEQSDNIVLLIGLFVGAEGAKDAVASYAHQRYVTPVETTQDAVDKMLFNDDEDEVDKDRIVPGL